jgi:hypothetical protein
MFICHVRLRARKEIVICPCYEADVAFVQSDAPKLMF